MFIQTVNHNDELRNKQPAQMVERYIIVQHECLSQDTFNRAGLKVAREQEEYGRTVHDLRPTPLDE